MPFFAPAQRREIGGLLNDGGLIDQGKRSSLEGLARDITVRNAPPPFFSLLYTHASLS